MSEEAAVAAEASTDVDATPPTAELANDPMIQKMAAEFFEDPTPAGAEAKGEELAAEAKPEDEPEAAQASPEPWDDLSDAQPWTKERHQKIREQHVADRRRISSLLSKLHDQKTKFRGKVEKFKTDKTQIELLNRRVATDLEALRVGSAEQALDALGRLSQRDPHQLYEGMSLAMLGRGNQPKADPKLAAIEAKLEALIEGGKRNHQAQTEEQHTVQTRREIRACLGSAEEWPVLAQIATKSPEQAAEEFEIEYVNQSKAAGRWLDVEAVADRIERRLRKSQPLRQAQNVAAAQQADRDQATRAQANPETAQSPPRSLSPNLSATSGAARRQASEEELQAEFVRSAPDSWFDSFGSFGSG